ncbi:MAG: glucuronate isomerase, partial [Spirochaetales bacterium]|nr:glucuronate isomerase [Spirochaetales bacterium]
MSIKPFLSEDFLLDTETARYLYHEYAEALPLFDFHSHLSIEDIVSDRIFGSITEAWLDNDHYKWRAMRWNGIEERFCTGPAGDYERFSAWAETVPHTIRNPLFHWTHIELKRYFNISDRLLNGDTAESIYAETCQMLKTREYSVRNLLKKMNVDVLCTTDDPVSGLTAHKALLEENFEIRVLPTFRPDTLFAVHDPGVFLPWIRELGRVSGIKIKDRLSLTAALKQRRNFFHDTECRLADHSLDSFDWIPSTAKEADAIIKKVLAGKIPDKK